MKLKLTESELITLIEKVVNEQSLSNNRPPKTFEKVFTPDIIGKLKTLNDGIYKGFDKLYDYKLSNTKWFFRRKNDDSSEWKSLEKYPKAIEKLNNLLRKQIDKDYKKATREKFITGFQLWMNKTYPNWFKGSKIDQKNLGKDDLETKNALKRYKKIYINILKKNSTGSNTMWDDIRNLASVAGMTLEKFLSIASPSYSAIKKVSSMAVEGIKKFLRRKFPNVAQLFFSRDLNETDFNDNQLRVIKSTVYNAVKRTGKLVGSTEYNDYGSNFAQKWFGPGGVKSADMILNTLESNPIFMVATTLGRFSYKIQNGELKVTDVYDFSPIPDAKTKLNELEGLTYPQKLMKIKDQNPKAGWYACIRHLAYLENPDTGLNKKPQVNINLDFPKNIT